MALKRLKKLNSDDRVVKQFQEQVDITLNQILDKQILDGTLIKEVNLLSAKTVEVEHKLGRKLIGYFVIRKRANSIVWDSQDTNQRADRTLALNCSADVKIDLWVF